MAGKNKKFNKAVDGSEFICYLKCTVQNNEKSERQGLAQPNKERGECEMQKNMQGKMRKAVALALAGMAILGIFAACAKEPAPQEGTAQSQPMEENQGAASAQRRDTLTIATESEPPTLHPFDQKAVTTGYMTALVYNRLTRIDPETLEPQLDLAAAYENVGETEWVFTLRQGVKFHDGSSLDAQDVKASMEYAQTFATTRDYTSFCKEVQVVDDYTVKIVTDGPYAMTLNDLASLCVLPSELIDAGADFNETPVGTGPYRFVEWVRGDRLSFEKNQEFFDQDRQPSIRHIVWRVVPEGSSRTIALQAGEADFVMEVEAADIGRLEEDETLRVQKNDGTRLNFFAMNSEIAPFDNKLFRKAVSSAIDRDAVVTVACDGEAQAAVSHASPAFAGSSDVNAAGYDPEKAKEYLAQSGIDPEKASFTCVVSNDTARPTAEVIQANLAEIGVKMDIESMDYAAHLNAIMSGNYTTAVAGYTSSNLYSFVSGLYHSSAVNAANLARVQDPMVDFLIDTAKTQLDPAEQRETFVKLSEYLNDWTAFAPLYQTTVVRAYHKDLKGVVVGKNGNVPFELVHWAEE